MSYTRFNTSHITINLTSALASQFKNSVSIHPILLLIAILAKISRLVIGFNTSHITINHVYLEDYGASITVSIHPILLLITLCC